MTNRVLVGGNYWMGLHAQWTPTSRNDSAGGCGGPDASSQGSTPPDMHGEAPIKQIYGALKPLERSGVLGQWTYDAHQYFDYYS